MRILVTGGAGFIGSRLVRALVEEGHAVAVVDNLSTGKSERIEDLLRVGRVLLSPFDILDSDQLERLVDLLQVEAIVHLAAVSDVQTCEDDRERAIGVNVLGTAAVFRAARLCESVQRVIVASSAAVYGESERADETAVLSPAGVYGNTKLWDEQIVRQKAARPSVISLRFGNVYGALDVPGVIPEFFRAVAGDLPLRVYGTGEQVRDFVHVDDIVRAIYTCLRAPTSGEAAIKNAILNVSTGKGTTINTLVDWFQQKYQEIVVERDEPREADIVHSVLDSNLILGMLGFWTQVELADGLERMAAELSRKEAVHA